MADKIADFLADMAKDPSLADFKKNPDAHLARSGLSKEQRSVLKTGDKDKIGKMIDEESGSSARAVMFETTPEPPPPPEM